jgi:lipopolysaccharide/colanic/teichoic acid biosynthesis glycosyltransferase/glycosyltransferase involved in cell wall biosynthesis
VTRASTMRAEMPPPESSSPRIGLEREPTPRRALRVLFITQYFPPETGAAPARAFHFVRALRRMGHEVEVVTGLPNHPSGVVHRDYAAVRRATETLDGARVERVFLYATPKKTAFTRLWNHLTFAWSALPVALARPRPDVVLASTPPLFLGVTAWMVSRFRGVPLVLDCRDDWPQAAIALGELSPGFVTSALAALARFLKRRAARVITVTPGMLRQFERGGIDVGRLDLITNGADADLFTPGRPSATEAARPFTVLYAGTHGLVHGMEALIDAAEQLDKKADVRFVLVGDGVAKPALERRVQEAGLSNVTFHPSQSPEALVDTIRSADVCVATTRAHTFCGETIPVKIFDYLACGRPVIAAVSGDAAEVVSRSGGGVVVEPGNGAAIAVAIESLAADSGRRAELGRTGAEFVRQHYSRRAAGERLERLLADVHRRATGRAIAPRPGGLYGLVRRLFDVVASGLLLILLSPLLLAIGLLVRLDSPGPALFRQRRVGRGSREFTILKFRTMRVGAPDLASHLMGPGSSLVTPIGKILRRTSLDELPQLWNVLAGEMTLIGPRPALFNQDDLIAMRQEVGADALKPGVTGWAQIHGRDEIALETKVQLDRYYLENVSPLLDLWIVARTAVILFSDRGVY